MEIRGSNKESSFCYRAFGERLRELAKENGLKVKDLSELTGKSCSTISNWLNGKGTPPKPCELYIITRRLNTTFEYLATGNREVRDLNQVYNTESIRQKIREAIG